MFKQNRTEMLTDADIGHRRICLAVSVEYDHVVLLLASTQPRTTYAGTEHRWVPFDGSPLLPLQPRMAVKTAPTANAFTNPSPARAQPYLCFTHALKVQPITANMLLPAFRKGASGFTRSFYQSGSMLFCPNIDQLKIVHEAYWQGVRYDNTTTRLRGLHLAVLVVRIGRDLDLDRDLTSLVIVSILSPE